MMRVRALLRRLLGDSLASRAAWLVGAVFVATFALVGWLALQTFERQFLRQAGDHQLAMMHALADTLDHKLDAAQEVLRGAARLVEPAQLRDAGLAGRFLQSRTFLLRSFEQGICLHDGAARQIACSQGEGPEVRHDAIERALRTGQAQLGVRAGAPREVEVLMAAPVFAADRRVAAVLTGRLALFSSQYAGKLMSTKLGRTGYLYMVDGQRQMLMHPDASRLLKTAARPGQNLGLDRALGEGYQGSLENVNSQGLRALSTFVRLPRLGWVLAGNYPIDEVHEPSQRSLQLGLALLAAAALLLTALLVQLLRRLFRPVQSLAQHLRALGQGRPLPFQTVSHGEVAQIATAYNQMLADLGRSEQQRQANEARVLELNARLEQRVRERTAELQHANQELASSLTQITSMQDALVRNGKVMALSRLVAGLAHELNTPLGNALTVATTLSAGNQDFARRADAGALRRSELRSFLDSSRDAALLVERSLQMAIALVGNMRELADTREVLEKTRFDVGRRVEAWIDTQRHRLGRDGVELRLQLEHGCDIESYAVALDRVLTQLLDNALGHAFAARPNGSPAPAITLKLETSSGQAPVLVFADNGLGIDAAQLDRVFDPFFAGTLGRQGAGLGLSIVHHLVCNVIGGHISVESDPAHGTRFMIRFPGLVPG